MNCSNCGREGHGDLPPGWRRETIVTLESSGALIATMVDQGGEGAATVQAMLDKLPEFTRVTHAFTCKLCSGTLIAAMDQATASGHIEV